MEVNTLELIGIAVAIVVSILVGVWIIFSKMFGVGRFSRRMDEPDKRNRKRR